MRCRREHLLYHGTLLYDFALELIEAYLAMPPRMPGYRAGREHHAFVANLPLGRQQMSLALRQAWDAQEQATPPNDELVQRLIAEKYARHEWNFRY